MVTGADSYVGNALIAALVKNADCEIRVTARWGSFTEKNIKPYTINGIGDEPDFSEALQGCDVVYHCATTAPINSSAQIEFSTLQRINVTRSAHLARQAAIAGVKRFVFLSTVQVNGDITPAGKKFFADSLPRPKFAVGISMLNAENELKRIARELEMELVVVRAPLVYGPECSNIFRAVQVMVRYCIPLPFGSTNDNVRSLVGIDNLIDFLLCVGTHPRAANETFIVSDDHDISTLEIFQLLAKTDDRTCTLWPFPTKLLSLFNSYIGRRAWGEFMFENMVVDQTKNRALLNWFPPYSIENQFTRSWEKRQIIGS